MYDLKGKLNTTEQCDKINDMTRDNITIIIWHKTSIIIVCVILLVKQGDK